MRQVELASASLYGYCMLLASLLVAWYFTSLSISAYQSSQPFKVDGLLFRPLDNC